MDLGRAIDAFLEPFAPRLARRRTAERMALEAMRGYNAATGGRRSKGGWRRSNTSADRELARAQAPLRDIGYDLVRNNVYAAVIDQQLTAHLVGDGIAPRAVHKNAAVRKRAQAALDAFFKSKVDGRNDFYALQKLATSAMIVGGDAVVTWGPDDKGPDGFCQVLEGAFLDHNKNEDRQGANRIVQGVEFDKDTGVRVAYWLLPRHPGDLGGFSQSKRTPAALVDHVFEQRRSPQARGVSWLAPVAEDLRDVADTFDAKRVKEKVAACLALVLTPPDGSSATTPFDEDGEVGQGASAGGEGRPVDTIRPGMVFRARPGETATTVNPPQSGEGVSVLRQSLMAVAALTIPYHILTGDPSQANYSSLRALTLPFWQRLDDIQQNVLVPHLCEPAAARRMKRLALETGDRRFLEVTWTWSMPVRRFVDPIKDFAGELAEIRAGVKSLTKALTERGLNPEEHLAEIAALLKLADELGLALDSDPRRVNASGALQPPAGYLYGGAQPQGS